MLNTSKLAVLVPVYNGGDRLCSTLMSCAGAGLSADRYEIIVVDNCSSDGAPNRVPFRDPQGGIVQVHRNQTNLGRVGNWNRAVAIAREQGFRYVTFLFAGDSWIPNGSLPQLFDLVQQSGSAIGLSSFAIANDEGTTRRYSQRFYVSGGEAALVAADEFLTKLVESGVFPLGPLQANIYRISRAQTIRFDESLPTRTDVDATLRFVQSSNCPVAIVSKPFFQWREYSGRFHMSMGTRQTIGDYIDTFEFACERTNAEVDFALAKSRLILNSIRLAFNDAPASQWPALCGYLLRYAARAPHPVRLANMLSAIWLRFGRGRRLLEFGPGHPQPVPHGEQCVTH